MRAKLLQLVVRLYPRSWQRQYGSEIEVLLRELHEDGGRCWTGMLVDLALWSVPERARLTQRASMGVAALGAVMVGLLFVLTGESSRPQTAAAPPSLVVPGITGASLSAPALPGPRPHVVSAPTTVAFGADRLDTAGSQTVPRAHVNVPLSDL